MSEYIPIGPCPYCGTWAAQSYLDKLAETKTVVENKRVAVEKKEGERVSNISEGTLVQELTTAVLDSLIASQHILQNSLSYAAFMGGVSIAIHEAKELNPGLVGYDEIILRARRHWASREVTP